jgi:hypothetical protein
MGDGDALPLFFLSLDPADIFRSHRNPFRQQRVREEKEERISQTE